MINDQQMARVRGQSDADASNEYNDILVASKVLTVLSKHDALVIFTMAKNGIEADTATHTKIGLTRKQYYTRLMQLKNVGLVEKKGNIYYQTTMGSFLQENCINAVIHANKNSKKMAMIDVLRREGNCAEEDLLQMKSFLLSLPPVTS